jgi:hypothetical protein
MDTIVLTTRHNGGNTLKSQGNHKGLRAPPLNPVECEKTGLIVAACKQPHAAAGTRGSDRWRGSTLRSAPEQGIERRRAAWTCGAGWDRVAPQGCPGAQASCAVQAACRNVEKTTGYTGTQRALGAKLFRPLCRVSSMLLQGAMRRRQVSKRWRLAEAGHGDAHEACLALRGTPTQTHLVSCVCQCIHTMRQCHGTGPRPYTEAALPQGGRGHLHSPGLTLGSRRARKGQSATRHLHHASTNVLHDEHGRA